MAYLVVLGAGSVWLAASSWESVTSYRSGYALDRRFEAGPALSQRVVLVVLDGLRVDRSRELDGFSSLADRGASGTLRVALPSLSNPARAALVTGAWPEVSGVTNNATFAPPPVQSLFGLAHGRGLTTGAFGTRFWPRAFGDDLEGVYGGPSSAPASYAAHDLVSWQGAVCAEAESFLGRASSGFLVIGLLAGDDAGHEYGGASTEYAQITAAVDGCLQQIADALGPAVTVVAVSDHGHIDRWGKGGHGGDEPEVLQAPFAMAGPGVRRSPPLRAQLVDIAPTLSVLLGIPIPANSQGRVLWEALDVPPELEGSLRGLEAAQRTALGAHMPDREQALLAQRRARTPIAAASCALFLFLALVALRGQGLWPYARALALFAVSFVALGWILQLGLSISTVVRQEYLNSFFARLVGAAVCAFAIAAHGLVQRGVRGSHCLPRLAMVITSGLGLFVTATYYTYGLRMEGWMIEIGPGFRAYLALLAIVGVVVGVLMTLAAVLVLGRSRRRES